MLLLLVASCAPISRSKLIGDKTDKALQDNSGLTGSTYTHPITNQEIPYTDTVSSNTLQNVKENLSKEWEVKNIGEESKRLALAVSKTDIQVLKNNSSPTNLVANINIGTERLQFNILIKGNQIPETKRYGAQKLDYTLYGECIDLVCNEVTLYLSKYTNNKPSAKYGFIFRTTKAKFQTQLPDSQKEVKDPKLRAIYEKYRDGQEIEVKDFVSALAGPSTSKVKLDDLDLNIKNIDTAQETSEIEVEGDSSNEIQAELLGNSGVKSKENEDAPRAANDTIVIKSKNERVYARLNRDGNDNIFDPPKKVNGETSNSTLQNTFNQYMIKVNTRNPRVLDITLGFEKYRNWSGLKYSLNDFFSRRSKKSVQEFFDNIKPVEPDLQKIADKESIPNTMVGISFRESTYFINKKIQIGDACELGAFQMTYNTGKNMVSRFPDLASLSILPIAGHTLDNKGQHKCHGKNLIFNPNDSRQFLAASWMMSARYLNLLSGMFKDSPLIIMAYNMGEGAVSRFLSDFKTLDFSRLSRENITGNQYARDFLALYFIGANPEKYGIIRNQPAHIQYSCEDVYTPLQIKQGMCEARD